MPETLTPEIAHDVVRERRSERATLRRHEEIVEILEALCLACVAIATAWSGYETARWDGRQSQDYGVANRERALSNRAATRGGQLQLYDTSTMSFWLQAKATHDVEAMRIFQRRFRPEFRRAYVAWLATRPFTNPAAPPGPSFMPQYHVSQLRLAAVHDARADAAFEKGTSSRETGDKWLRNTVLLAVVLFLTALAPRFKIMGVRVALLGVSIVLLTIALYFVATYPDA